MKLLGECGPVEAIGWANGAMPDHVGHRPRRFSGDLGQVPCEPTVSRGRTPLPGAESPERLSIALLRPGVSTATTGMPVNRDQLMEVGCAASCFT